MPSVLIDMIYYSFLTLFCWDFFDRLSSAEFVFRGAFIHSLFQMGLPIAIRMPVVSSKTSTRQNLHSGASITM